jgi:hypothetical protein
MINDSKASKPIIEGNEGRNHSPPAGVNDHSEAPNVPRYKARIIKARIIKLSTGIKSSIRLDIWNPLPHVDL